MIFAENSMARLEGVFPQAEWVPKLIQRLQEYPEDVLADFESIRKYGIVELPSSYILIERFC
jgi:hypothetical protein